MEAIGHYRFTFDVTKICSHAIWRLLVCSESDGIVLIMVSSRLTGFWKDEDCPSSDELLEFQNSVPSRMIYGEISAHLNICEFCSAEVEFYNHYPQEEGVSEPAPIPEPLFELAQALLKNKYTDSRSLNALLLENEDLMADVAI